MALARNKDRKLIRTCSIWRALEVVGDTPILLILEAIWLGDRRFDQIQHHTGLQKALTSNRLKKLIEVGILEKQAYSEHSRRFNYVLTQKGVDIYWVALMLLRWEKTWSAHRDRLQVRLMHGTCGQEVEPEPLCGHCREVIRAQDVDWQEGPGLGWMTPDYSRRRQHRDSSGETDLPSLFVDAAKLMGDRWSGLILRSVFTGLRKFDEILKDTAMATNILTERLQWLQETGILSPVLYQSAPDRYEYRVTNKGLDYYPVLVMLQQWGDRYYGAEEGPPVLLYHRTCGQELNAYVGCSSCREPMWPQETTFEVVGRQSVTIET